MSGVYRWGYDAQKNLQANEKLHEWFKLGLCPEFRSRLATESDLDAMYPSKTALPYPIGPECEGLVTHFLRGLRTAADEYMNGTDRKLAGVPKEYIITVPAMWTDRAQDATRRCAEAAGMGSSDDIHVIAEPEAAGIYALDELAYEASVGDAFVVCDAGGG